MPFSVSRFYNSVYIPFDINIPNSCKLNMNKP